MNNFKTLKQRMSKKPDLKNIFSGIKKFNRYDYIAIVLFIIMVVISILMAIVNLKLGAFLFIVNSVQMFAYQILYYRKYNKKIYDNAYFRFQDLGGNIQKKTISDFAKEEKSALSFMEYTDELSGDGNTKDASINLVRIAMTAKYVFLGIAIILGIIA